MEFKELFKKRNELSYPQKGMALDYLLSYLNGCEEVSKIDGEDMDMERIKEILKKSMEYGESYDI